MAIARLAREARTSHSPRPPRRAVLWAIAVAGVAAGGATMWLALNSDHVAEPGLQAALMDWITLPYVFAGLIAWYRRPDSRFGPLMVVAGFSMFLSTLAWANSPLAHTIGAAFDLLPAIIFLHVFLAFPSGRLEHPFERALVAAGYVTAFGLQLVWMLLGGDGPDNLLAVVAKPGLTATLQDVQLVAISALCLTGVGVLAARRWGAGRPPLRRSMTLLVDSFAFGLVMIAALFLTGAFNGPAFETIRRATFVVIGLAPAAWLMGLLSARLARSALGDLLLEMRAEPAPAHLRDALARALRDPSLQLAYWLPEYGSWADVDGRAVTLPAAGDGWATQVVERDGEPVAALVHDASLDEPELLEAVSAAAGIALDNARLHAELAARLDELRGSRVRVIEAGQKERQRLERNLHDGAQQRLVALSLELTMLKKSLDADSEAGSRIEHARNEIATSLQELRDIARGLHPAIVSGHGLAVALESLAARAPVPVRLTVTLEGRLPEQLEVAAYYLVSESIANIGKHAQARSASVDVSRDNGQVVIEIVDDGIGGANTEAGSGLRGLADRVEALDGRLRVWTPHGHGTRVRAEIPCA
jgi:signal transduction histidine kinase